MSYLRIFTTPNAELLLWPLAGSESELLPRAGLGDKELAALEGIKGEARRREWLAARVMAREVFGAGIAYLPSGQPILQEPREQPEPFEKQGQLLSPKYQGEPPLSGTRAMASPLPEARPRHISVSHTDGWVALLAADRPCGVDIERTGRNVARVSERFATAAELAASLKVLPGNPALAVWCAKEALYKAAGIEGLDFLSDMTLVATSPASPAGSGTMKASVRGTPHTLEWLRHEELLIVLVIH